MLEEFKKFAMRGNVVDLAIGVIIGAAFGAIVNSLVADIVMPLISSVTGGLDSAAAGCRRWRGFDGFLPQLLASRALTDKLSARYRSI